MKYVVDLLQLDDVIDGKADVDGHRNIDILLFVIAEAKGRIQGGGVFKVSKNYSSWGGNLPPSFFLQNNREAIQI